MQFVRLAFIASLTIGMFISVLFSPQQVEAGGSIVGHCADLVLKSGNLGKREVVSQNDKYYFIKVPGTTGNGVATPKNQDGLPTNLKNFRFCDTDQPLGQVVQIDQAAAAPVSADQQSDQPQGRSVLQQWERGTPIGLDPEANVRRTPDSIIFRSENGDTLVSYDISTETKTTLDGPLTINIRPFTTFQLVGIVLLIIALLIGGVFLILFGRRLRHTRLTPASVPVASTAIVPTSQSDPNNQT